MAKVYKGNITGSIVELSLQDEAAGGGSTTLEGLTDTNITTGSGYQATGSWVPNITGIDFTNSGTYNGSPYYTAANAFPNNSDATLSNYNGSWLLADGIGASFSNYYASGPVVTSNDPSGSYTNVIGFTSTDTIAGGSNLQDNYVLTWDQTASKWVPEAAAVSGGTVQGTDGTYDIQAANEGATAGGTRGENSVDLQTNRTSATQVAGGANSVISGGKSNTASGNYSFAAGNTNTASGNYSVVCGGNNNQATYKSSAIIGGTGNTASGYYLQGPFVAMGGFVGGGDSNQATGAASSISGGYICVASGAASTVSGGYQCTASGYYSGVFGGFGNTASASYAFVLGGLSNTASGNYSIAAGRRSKTGVNAGTFRFADSTNLDFTAGQGANTFGCRFSGGYKFYTDINSTVGAELVSGGTAWSVLSDVNAKENFQEIDGASILRKLDEMPVTTWNLKSQDESIRHMGPMAQDFHAAFGLGSDDKRIETGDSDGVLFAAVKELITRVHALEDENSVLKAKVSKLENHG